MYTVKPFCKKDNSLLYLYNTGCQLIFILPHKSTQTCIKPAPSYRLKRRQSTLRGVPLLKFIPAI
jgi:hypothetical protein